MFVLKKSNSYYWPVKTESPKNGGGFEKEQFEIDFKRISETRIKEVFGPSAAEKEKVSDITFCREVIVGWKGIKDENGEDIPFSESSLNELLDQPGIAKYIVMAFLDSIAGSKVKN